MSRRYHPGPGTDNAEFNCVYEGQWFYLCSLSRHLKEKVDPTGTLYLIRDNLYRTQLVPKSKIHIRSIV